MKIGFISSQDPNNKKTWSGTMYLMLNQLKKKYDVEWCGSIKVSVYELLFHKILRKLYLLLLNKNYSIEFSVFYSKKLARRIEKVISKKKFDLLFVPGSQEIAFLETDIPIIYLTDAVFAGMIEYYGTFSNLANTTLKQGNLIESLALKKADQIIFSSMWSRNDAFKYYLTDRNKLNVLKFGANLNRIPHKDEIRLVPSDTLNLLFLGVNWLRKGGDIAYETYKIIKEKGIKVKLVIIGCNPSIEDPNIRIIPFINKNNESEFNELYEIMLNTDFMVLPTRAECSAIVNSEASAFGIPVISTRTGGQSDYVEDGVNGCLLPLTARGGEYADAVLAFFSNPESFRNIRIKTRLKYEKELNWDCWLAGFHKVVDKIKDIG